MRNLDCAGFFASNSLVFSLSCSKVFICVLRVFVRLLTELRIQIIVKLNYKRIVLATVRYQIITLQYCKIVFLNLTAYTRIFQLQRGKYLVLCLVVGKIIQNEIRYCKLVVEVDNLAAYLSFLQAIPW